MDFCEIISIWRTAVACSLFCFTKHMFQIEAFCIEVFLLCCLLKEHFNRPSWLSLQFRIGLPFWSVRFISALWSCEYDFSVLLHSELLNNNTCHFTDWQKIFQKYKMNSDRYVRHIEQLQQTDLWTSIRTEDCSEHLLNLLKHHVKTLNLLYS